MIRLEDFPRPRDDNGRGIHWSASPYHLSGSELDYWMDELLAMNMKWVKVIDDGGGSSLELCRRLVNIGIMPVVRLYLGNPGHVQTRNLEAMRRLLDVGAYYFETNNEPDLAIEWEGGVVPRNWLDIVVDNFIIDASEIINLGAYPAFPAMGVGTIVNPFSLIVDRGRQDLFDNGAWLAIHNYVINHPLDYPYDVVNQTGRPLTQEEYEGNRWGWDQDKLAVINRLRSEGAKPGVTIRDDATCWLAYALWNEQIEEAFGHSVPVMSTEGGVVIGDRQDGRYPRNDARRHDEVTLWIQEFLTSSAPPWYFTVFHWLIANNAMGQNRPGWETQCWYGNWWDAEFGLSGHLPTVDTLKGTPVQVRRDAVSDGVILGKLTDHTGQPVAHRRLRAIREGKVRCDTESREDGLYRLWGLPPGTYAVAVDQVQGAVLPAVTVYAHQALTQNIQLPGPLSALGGQVTDSTGAPRAMQTVALYQTSGRVASTVTEEQGYYGFAALPAETYRAEVTGAPVQSAELDGQRPVTVNFVVPVKQEYEFRVLTKRLLPQSESQGRHVFYGLVRDEFGGPIDGVKIEMNWAEAARDTLFPVALSGSDPGKARGYFEFIHTPGEFNLRLLDVAWPAQIADHLKTRGLPGLLPDQSVSYEIIFQLVLVGGTSSDGTVTGTLSGGTEGMNLLLLGEGLAYSTWLNPDGSFKFEKLPPATYRLDVEGVGPVASDIVVDGQSVVSLSAIDLGPARRSIIEGTVSDLEGKPRPDVTVLLRMNTQEVARRVTDAWGRYRFASLVPGTYGVETLDPPAKSSEVALDGTQVQTLDLHLPDTHAPKSLRHYLLFGSPGKPGGRANFRLARKYILTSGVSAGFDPGEAAHAERVTIIGDEQAISRETEERLRQAGCEVGRLGGDSYAVAQALARLLGE